MPGGYFEKKLVMIYAILLVLLITGCSIDQQTTLPDSSEKAIDSPELTEPLIIELENGLAVIGGGRGIYKFPEYYLSNSEMLEWATLIEEKIGEV